jgi:hypothetical protein
MKKLMHWVAAASLGVSGLAFTTTARAADDTVGNKFDRTVDKTKNAAHDAKANWENGRAYTLLAQVSNASLTKGGLDDLLERFNDADRNRIGTWIKDKNNKDKLDILDGRIAQFQKDWKAKYGSDFKIHKDNEVFGNAMFTVIQGEIGKDAQLAGERVPAGDNTKTGKDQNLEKGRNVVYVDVGASHGLPELKIPLIHELPDMWKIDVPDSVTGQVLYDNVLKHLTMVNEHKDQWPSDENDGYRMVTHHLLMGIMDVNETNAAQPAGAKLGGDTAKPAEPQK